MQHAKQLIWDQKTTTSLSNWKLNLNIDLLERKKKINSKDSHINFLKNTLGFLQQQKKEKKGRIFVNLRKIKDNFGCFSDMSGNFKLMYITYAIMQQRV